LATATPNDCAHVYDSAGMRDYVHGYSERESTRLKDQADTLAALLHHDTAYPPGSRVLEAGCGTGAQTVSLAANSPEADILSIDIRPDSLALAERAVTTAGVSNITFQQADLYHLPFDEASFDHVFVCFVLEHLPNPDTALRCLGRVLTPGGTITVIEGDHGSYYCHPRSSKADRVVQCLIDLQAEMGGDALIGRRVYPLLVGAGFRSVSVSPRMVYADSSRPDLVEGFTKNTFTAMVEGVGPQAIASGMIDKKTWNEGIAALYRAAEADGTFCYTFFKGVAIR